MLLLWMLEYVEKGQSLQYRSKLCVKAFCDIMQDDH